MSSDEPPKTSSVALLLADNYTKEVNRRKRSYERALAKGLQSHGRFPKQATNGNFLTGFEVFLKEEQ